MEARAGLGLVTCAVLAGELAAASRPLPAGVWPVLVAATVLAGVVRGPRPWNALPFVAAVGAFALGAARMSVVTAPRLGAEHVARLALPLATTLTAHVVAPPDRRGERVVLWVEADAVGRGTSLRPATGLIRLAVRRPHRRWRYGDRLQVETTLRRPRNFDNPGGFDYVAHLARRGVLVTAFVWDGGDVVRLPAPRGGARLRLERWRTRLGAAIERAVPPPAGPVLQALVLGDEGAIDPSLRDAFSRAGVVHVLSVSGLHIALVATGAFAAARWLLGRSERALLAFDVERAARVLALGPVALYAALAGLGVATLRASLMVAAGVLAGLVGRSVDVMRALAIAALVIALWWPGSPLEVTFQLSFASVAALVCGVRRFGGAKESASSLRVRLRAAALASPCALVGVAPLTAFHFHQISLVGVFANPIVIPIFGSLAVGLGLAGALVEPWAPGLASASFAAAGLVLRPGIALVRALAAPAWAAVDVPIPTVFEVVLLYGALAGLLLFPRPAAKVLVGLAVAGLLADAGWWLHRRYRDDRMRVTFLDVGQGDAAVVELPRGRVLVVDAGGFPAGDFDTGAAVVGPYLWSRKILRIDALAMTHAHPDHCAGLAYLLAHHRPREFWWTGVPGTGAAWDRLQTALAASGARVRVLTADTALPGFPEVTVLHPPDATDSSLNNSSLTLRLRHGAASILLTGDIESPAEARLLGNPARLASTVLKVPHHGSRTSSTPAFVAAVAPRIAVISVGADNRYRLPSPEVEARYAVNDTCVLRTDHCGAIALTASVNPDAVDLRTMQPTCTCQKAQLRLD